NGDVAKAGIEASLKKSGLEYFDLYLLHQAMGDYFSAWRALEEAYEAGKLKAIGVSNFYAHVLVNFCETVRIKPMVNQVELHPVQRGVTVIPKSTRQERIAENFDLWDFSLTDSEMAQISALDLGYVGEAV
ncbi:aldo/keto reductase, partial [Klebsiella aerogenes]